jgi:hypothetical protein
MGFETSSFNPEVEPVPKQEKIKQLFGHCFEISRIEEGDRIPVGGESIFFSKSKYRS